nr:MAG TPA: hypothetical protein [Caudoviricetes sp.]
MERDFPNSRLFSSRYRSMLWRTNTTIWFAIGRSSRLAMISSFSRVSGSRRTVRFLTVIRITPKTCFESNNSTQKTKDFF